MKFVCPKCSMPLAYEGGAARCVNNHSYDRAKAGYYNLLLGRAGGTHGDNREMIEARRRFLDTGAYFPLASKLSELAEKYIPCGDIIDIGCGEGYYTSIVETSLAERGVRVFGFDISRDAVKYAAKRNRNICLAVASAYSMPVADESFDGAINMFSPLATGEVYRALKKDGIFIMAIPNTNHLFGLKKATYKTPYKNEVADTALPGFALIETARVAYSMKLNTKDEIHSLFMMTPYAYRTSKEDRDKVLSLDSLETEADFLVLIYRKT